MASNSNTFSSVDSLDDGDDSFFPSQAMSLSLRTRRTGAVGVTSGIGGCKRWLPFGLFGKFLLDALGTLGGSTEGASAGSSAGAPALLLVFANVSIFFTLVIGYIIIAFALFPTLY